MAKEQNDDFYGSNSTLDNQEDNPKDPWTLSSAVENILSEKKRVSNESSDPANEKLIQPIKRNCLTPSPTFMNI